MVRPLLIAALAFCGCGPLTFSTSLGGNATVPGGSSTMMLAALPLIGQLSNLDFDTNPDFKLHDVTRSQLVLARVDAASLQLMQPSSADFSFLDELQLVAKSGDLEAVFADELDIATHMPSTKSPLQLTLTKTNDVTAQVAQAPMSFVMRGKGRQPAADTQVQVSLTLHIEATPHAAK
jgi:hypothetical protein